VAVSGLGEFDLIDRLASLVAGAPAHLLKIGIGDDAAAWETEPRTMTVATADALVEGVHFDLATTSWRDLGWKALAENVSDVAAMGCLPRYAFVTLGLPATTPVAGIEDLYRGMGDCARAYGCTVAGGDVVRAPCMTLSVTLIGTSVSVGIAEAAPADVLLRRSCAHPGDAIAVTGVLGGSAAGLKLLQQGWRDVAEADRMDASRGRAEGLLVETHRRPMPRVIAGQELVAAGVRCAIDVSDGLVADVGHICEQSHLDGELIADQVPVHPAAATCFGAEALDLALSGGEDYELICVGPAARIAVASERLVARGEAPLTMIGAMRPQAGTRPQVRIRSQTGAVVPIQQGGYRHF
jgi:thiamine-monophosphate kinase